MEVLFYRVPFDGPYLPFPTIFNVRAWEKLAYHGRTPLGTDQNYFRKVLGNIPAIAAHAPQGNPALWVDGWSYAAWLGGSYGGTTCCNIWEMSGGGQGGGDWDPHACSPPDNAWASWIYAGPQFVLPGPFLALPQSSLPEPYPGPGNWASGFDFTMTVAPGNWQLWVYGAGVNWFAWLNSDLGLVQFNTTGGLVILSQCPLVFTIEIAEIPPNQLFFAIVLIAPWPVMYMTVGAQGGGSFVFDVPAFIDMTFGGQGGGDWFSWLQFPMGLGGQGGGAWIWRDYLGMEWGGEGGTTLPIWFPPIVIVKGGGGGGKGFPPMKRPIIGVTDGGQGGLGIAPRATPVVVVGAGGGGGLHFTVLSTPIVFSGSGSQAGGSFTITP
jgi:hypothetical protein